MAGVSSHGTTGTVVNTALRPPDTVCRTASSFAVALFVADLRFSIPHSCRSSNVAYTKGSVVSLTLIFSDTFPTPSRNFYRGSKLRKMTSTFEVSTNLDFEPPRFETE